MYPCKILKLTTCSWNTSIALHCTSVTINIPGNANNCSLSSFCVFTVYFSLSAVPPPQIYQDMRQDSLERAQISTVPGAAWRA